MNNPSGLGGLAFWGAAQAAWENDLDRIIALNRQDEEDRYYAALSLVERIDEDLETGRRHYRDSEGLLLGNLDEVVRAILNNELQEQINV